MGQAQGSLIEGGTEAAAEDGGAYLSTPIATNVEQAPGEAIAGASASSSSQTGNAATAEPASQTVEVNIKCIDGTNKRLEVSANSTGRDLKDKASRLFGVAPELQRLICRGHVVQDSDLVSRHVSENGQTIHLVQRPVAPAEPNQTANGSAGSASAAGAAQGPGQEHRHGQIRFMMPQVHFQVASTSVPGGQEEVLNILQHVLRQTGIIPPGQDPPGAPGEPSDATGSGGPHQVGPGMLVHSINHFVSSAAAEAAGAPQTEGGGSSESAAAASAASTGAAAGTGAGEAASTRPLPKAPPRAKAPPGAPREPAAPPPPPGPPPPNSVAPLQFFFQELNGFPGAINLGDILQASIGENMAAPRDPPPPSALPWRNLRRFQSQAARLAGRGPRGADVPMAPNNEMPAFLAALQVAHAQLGVVLAEAQTAAGEQSLLNGRMQSQLAGVFASAGRTYRGLSIALQRGPGEEQPQAALATPAQEEDEPDEEEAEESGTGVELPATSTTSNNTEAVGASAESSIAPSRLHQESQSITPNSEQCLAAQLGTGLQDQESAQQTAAYEASRAADDLLSGLPPEVAACWTAWTQTEAFSRVLAEAVQPPFSDAYRAGDATGSFQAPVLPPPPLFLPLRWQRALARVEDTQESPGPPEHLSRAYLSAFLRDMGRHVATDPTYTSVPEVAARYPHLARLADFVQQEVTSTPASPAS